MGSGQAQEDLGNAPSQPKHLPGPLLSRLRRAFKDRGRAKRRRGMGRPRRLGVWCRDGFQR
jgi:hypothetical protein